MTMKNFRRIRCALLCFTLGSVMLFGAACGSKETGSGQSSATEAITAEKLIELGQKYLAELNYEQARAIYEQALILEPKNLDLYYGIAQAYKGLEDNDKALEYLENGIKIAEENGDAGEKEVLGKLYLSSAQLYEIKGDYKSASNNYENAVKEGTAVDESIVRQNQNKAIDMSANEKADAGEYDSALNIYEQLKQYNDSTSLYTMYKGETDIYLRQNQIEKAINVIDAGIKATNDDKLVKYKEWIKNNTLMTESHEKTHMEQSASGSPIINNYYTYTYDNKRNMVTKHEKSVVVMDKGSKWESTSDSEMQYNYTYDEQGRKTQENIQGKRYNGDKVMSTNTYTYDNDGNVTIMYSNGDSVTKDSNGNTIMENGKSVTKKEYIEEYDDNGNLIKQTEKSSTASWGPLDTYYSYDENGRCIQIKDNLKGTDQLFSLTIYEYDYMDNKIKYSYRMEGDAMWGFSGRYENSEYSYVYEFVGDIKQYNY